MPTVTTLSGVTVTLDLETRDFEGYRTDVLRTGGLADQYAPDWTDRSEADLGVAMVEAFAFFADNLSYYQDRHANEALPLSCIQRRSIIEHCRFLNYELRSTVSASVEMTIVANGAGTLPAKTQFEVDTTDGSTAETFELAEEFIIAGAGTYTGKIAYHGVTTEDTPTSSDGSADQTIELEGSPVALNTDGTSSLEVWVTEGGPTELWTQVSSFIEYEPTDKIYKIQTDEDDVVTVIFGDGVTGKKPASGVDNIEPIYRVGGGASGNQVGADKLTRLVGSYTFIDSVTNPAAPSGGLNKETLDEAKENAPLSLVAMNRCVRHEDYKTAALAVSGVSKALAYRDEHIPFTERVVIAAGGSNPVPTGTWNPRTEVGTGLIGSVGAALHAMKTTPCIVQVDAVNVVDILAEFTVYLFSNTRQKDAERYIQDALTMTDGTGLLDVESQDMGSKVPVSLVMKTIEDISGVDYVDVDRFQRLPYGKRITDTSSDFTFGSFVYGASTIREVWTLEFLTATTFQLTGENSGLQTNTGTIGVAYLIDDSSFGVTITAGSIAPSVHERWKITTSPYVGNIQPDEDEICRLYGGTFTLSLSGGLG